MKRKLSVLLIVLLVISMTACTSSSNPEASVKGYLEALKSNNIEEMDEYINPDSDDQAKKVFNSGDELSDEAFMTAYRKLDYKILSSTIDGDNAIVEAEINAPNLGNILTELMQEAFSLAFASEFSEDGSEDGSEDDMDNLMNTMFLDKVNSDDMPMVKKNVKVNLIKENENWLINIDNNDEFINAITGNLMQIEEMFE